MADDRGTFFSASHRRLIQIRKCVIRRQHGGSNKDVPDLDQAAQAGRSRQRMAPAII
jgi:hypothetical protein